MLADQPPPRDWTAPLAPLVVERPYVQVAAFAAGGRRSVLLRSRPGGAVRAPCNGVVTFAGSVAGSPPTLTLACSGLRATLRWVGSPARRGTPVAAGTQLGKATAAQLGFSARYAAGRYLDPLTLLSGSRRRRVPPAGFAARARRSTARPHVAAAPHHAVRPVHLPAAAFALAAGSGSVAASGARPGRRQIAGAATGSAASPAPPVDWPLTIAGIVAVFVAAIASMLLVLRRERPRRSGGRRLAHLAGERR